MKRIISTVIFFTLTLVSLLVAQDFSSNQKVYSTIDINSDFADDRVLVVLNQQETMSFRNHTITDFEGIGIVDVQDLTSESKETLIEQINKRELLGLNGYELQGGSPADINPQEFRTILLLTLEQPSKENVINTILILEQREDILSAGVDFVLHPDSLPNDDMYSQQWALHGEHGIKAPQAWAIANGTGSTPIRVGIIDTGIQASHTDLNVNTALSRDFSLPHPYIPANVIDYHIEGHGTQVAGIVGAIGNNTDGITGVNWNVELVSLRIAPTNYGNSFASHLIRAVDFAGANGIPILNNSNGTDNFTGSNSDVNALTAAINQYPGLFVTSAGNANKNNDTNNKRFPSNLRLPNLITVGAINNSGQRSSFSNYGANTVCIYAPGGERPGNNSTIGIISTLPNYLSSNVGFPGYGTTCGTSIASPHVAGVAALYLAQYPDAHPHDIKHMILSRADTILISTPDGDQLVRRLNAYETIMDPPTFIYTEDTVMDAENLQGDIIIVKNGAVLRLQNNPINYPGTIIIIENSAVFLESSNYPTNSIGAIVADKSVFRLIDSTLNMENNNIEIKGSGSFMTLENGSIFNVVNSTIDFPIGIHYNSTLNLTSSNILLYENEIHASSSSKIVLLENSKITLFDSIFFLYIQSALNLQDNSQVSLFNSEMKLRENSTITFESQSMIELNNHSKLTSVSSQIRGQNPSNNFTSQSKIILNDSYINLCQDTVVENIGNGSHWGGIYINNSRPVPGMNEEMSVISGKLSGLYIIDIKNSEVSFIDADITENLNFSVRDQSNFIMKNSEYYDNGNGIKIAGGEFLIENSKIRNNSKLGLRLSNVQHPSKITNTLIYGNTGNGIENSNSLFTISESKIYENGAYGLSVLGDTKILIQGETDIFNNASIGIIAPYNGFPNFAIGMKSFKKPSVYNDIYDVAYLSAFDLNINSTNKVDANFLHVPHHADRFFPSMDHFLLSTGSHYSQFLPKIVDFIETRDYRGAFDLSIEIIVDFPEMDDSLQALTYLPFLGKALDEDINALVNFMEDIDHPNLERMAEKTIAIARMVNSEFAEAIVLYDEIIRTAPNPIERLMAELNQAYCHLQMKENGLRSFTDLSVHKPNNFDEYQELYDLLMNQIINQEEKEELPVEIPEKTQLLSNYPNPFNPSTTISFDLSADGNVVIDIFNIRGQKVKTLVNEHFNAGTHNVVWNGFDDNGRNVSSGVYFFKMQTEGFTSTRRMVMMK